MLKRENENVEFKKSSGEANDAMKSVCGMLNKFGEGTIFFGVKNDGTVIKNKITDSSLRDISRAVYESIEPKISPFIDTIVIDDIEIIRLSFQGNNQPYSSKGVYYKRVADENRPMSQLELLAMFQNKHYEDTWEKQITKYTEEDIDDESLIAFYDSSTKANRLEMKKYNKIDLLTMLGLLNLGHVNNAGYFLFGKKVDAELKMAVYATKAKINIIDMIDIRGNIYNLVNEAIAYIKKHINWKIEVGSRKREEIPEIPEKAIREIVVNSFAHAKYNDNSIHEINIFPDEIEIYNQGTFPEQYNPNDFIDNRIQSIRRNPLILDVLFRSKDVEKSGTGFARMSELCKLNNVKWKYEKLNNGFKFIFIRNNVTNTVTNIVTNTELTDIQIRILEIITVNCNIKVDEIASVLDISARTIQRGIKLLTEKGYVKRIGTKSGHWEILK